MKFQGRGKTIIVEAESFAALYRRPHPPKCALCGAFLVVQPDGKTATCTRCKSEWSVQ